MQDNRYNNSDIDKSTNQRERSGGKGLMFAVIGALVLVVIVVLVLMSREGHYEKGNNYLKEKRYAEALSEYNKIDANEKEFAAAQSKINYINGLEAYNKNMYDAAELYLSKVAANDEYFDAAQLMREKMKLLTEQNNKPKIDSVVSRKDTIIIKQETPNTPGTTKVEEAVNDADLSKRFYAKLDRIINSFEGQYQSASVAEIPSKKDYLSKMESLRRDLINSVYEAKEKDADLVQLKNDINTWVDKRIAYINKLISENSANVTNTSRSIKEEGDKLYFKMNTQRSKVKSKY